MNPSLDPQLKASIEDSLDHLKANLHLAGCDGWATCCIAFNPARPAEQFLVVTTKGQERLSFEATALMNPEWAAEEPGMAPPVNAIFRIGWEYEDLLPPELPVELFEAMYNLSRVEVVRLYPYIVDAGDRRHYLSTAGLISFETNPAEASKDWTGPWPLRSPLEHRLANLLFGKNYAADSLETIRTLAAEAIQASEAP